MKKWRMWMYLNGAYVEHDKASISPFDRGFLFSDGVYEVVRYYPPCGFFETEAHLARLRYGLEQLRIEGIDVTKIPTIMEELLTKNDQRGAQATTYIQITRGSFYPRQHFFPPAGTPPTVLMTTTPFKPHQADVDDGVRVLLETDQRWSRCDIKTTALLPSVLSRQHAVEAGVRETIWERDGLITEGTHTSVCVVKDGVLLTAPKSHRILPGITREVILRICGASGIRYMEVPIAVADLRKLQECLLVGTTTEVTPVVKVADVTIGNGRPGPIARKLQEELMKAIQRGGCT